MDYRLIKPVNQQRAVGYASGYMDKGAFCHKNLFITDKEAYFAV
jgi:hypothetical protein